MIKYRNSEAFMSQRSFHSINILLKNLRETPMQKTYWSSMSGKQAKSENYNLVTYRLTKKDGKTVVTLSRDNISTEKEKEHCTENWKKVLKKLKEVVENEKE